MKGSFLLRKSFSSSLVIFISILLWAACAPATAQSTDTRAGERQASSQPPEVFIAAASDLVFAFKDVVAAFEERTEAKVRLSLGSSGTLYGQILNGAPFDLFFSADVQYPQGLVESGLVKPGSIYVYGVGRIVIWVPRSSSIEVDKLGVASLLHPAVQKIAIPNPDHAPYGRAAAAALEHYHLYEQVRPKLVLGENVSQAAQFVQSSAADIGIIALSLAVAPPMKETGSYWEIPSDAYSKLEQAAIVLAHSQNPDLAEQFLQYLRDPEGKMIMKRYGFEVPGENSP